MEARHGIQGKTGRDAEEVATENIRSQKNTGKENRMDRILRIRTVYVAQGHRVTMLLLVST